MSPYQNQWVIIDESPSSSSPDKRNKRYEHVMPKIIMPFPPTVNPKDLISKPRKAKARVPTKPPNAFMIYRTQYVKELHAIDVRLPMRFVSSKVALAWRNEPENIIECYERIARDTSKLYYENHPKRRPQPKKPVKKIRKTRKNQKRKSGSVKSTFTPLVEHVNVLNYVDDVYQHYYNPIHYYYDHNQLLANHSLAYGGHNYYSDHMHSPLAFEYHHYDNSEMRSPSSLSATDNLISPNLHMHPDLISDPITSYEGMFNLSDQFDQLGFH